MRSYTLAAPAKINLHLEIIGDRPDGFHELVMILQSVALCDRVTLRAIGSQTLRVRCDHPLVPNDESNLAHRAATLMCDQFPKAFNQFGGVEILVDKAIPVGAGLAGGSTNAAAVLVGLNLMWNLGLTHGDIQDLGAFLGSDVPFCVTGGTAIGTGRGERLDFLPKADSLWVVLAKYRSLSVSTVWAYKTYRQQFSDTYVSDEGMVGDRQQQLHSGPLVSALIHHNPQNVGELIYNDLEKVVLPAHETVAHLKAEMQKLQPLGVMMSGSGPTVFALTETQAEAEALKQSIETTLNDDDLDLWVTQFIPQGIHVID
ncbi:MAG: 4-(cytidine 5'-diphospho)-2-C-methyl-D-erythritol kinase [Leptolyngbyaceae bacterium]|nr:4-(cytidine 5'-diphospho)-2-C-methyl-D-erythritol kinase [Leptolyngbyaceae bacterium]